MDSRPNHLKTHVEQCVKHGRRKINVFRYQEFLPVRPIGPVRMHENSARIIP